MLSVFAVRWPGAGSVSGLRLKVEGGNPAFEDFRSEFPSPRRSKPPGPIGSVIASGQAGLPRPETILVAAWQPRTGPASFDEGDFGPERNCHAACGRSQ